MAAVQFSVSDAAPRLSRTVNVPAHMPGVTYMIRRGPVPKKPHSPQFDAFIKQVALLAQQAGVGTLVIAAVDPGTQEADVIASAGAMEALRTIVGIKFGLGDGSDTEWT